MDLTLLFDHRFYQTEEGVVFSLKGYNYAFFEKRYLQVFERVNIAARLASSPAELGLRLPTEGEKVRIFSLGDWSGAAGYVVNYRRIRARLARAISRTSAIIVVVPSLVASVVIDQLLGTGHPYGVEVVGDPHDVFARGGFRHPLRKVFQWWVPRELRRQCSNACAAAYVTQDALQRRYPCPNLSIGASDVELPEEAFVQQARSILRGKHSFSIVTVGTLAHLYKAADVLLDAIAICLGRGLDVNLTIVGDGRHRLQLEAQAKRLRIQDRVRFVGTVPAGLAVRSILDSADLFCLPSRADGLPRALLEAMARALPCLGSRVGGVPELLVPEDMVHPGDALALASKIQEVLTHPERMAKMSERNLAKAQQYREPELLSRRLEFYNVVKDKTSSWLRQGEI